MLHPSLLTFMWGAVKGKKGKKGRYERRNKQTRMFWSGKLQLRMPEMLNIATQENCHRDYREAFLD